MAKTLIRTRIAPSPTGYLHIGTARTALFNELFAHQQGGQFIVRIEDTDLVRSRTEYELSTIQGLKWLGLNWDEGPDIGGDFGPYRQSERKVQGIYRQAIDQLLSAGLAYQVDGGQAIKLKVTSEPVHFADLIRGDITIQPATWGGDFVIARSPDDPVFHLAVVIDDELMKISHIIRGEDHLTNTARHILLQQALGYDTPQYAHLPLLLDQHRHKLSKRTGTAVDLQQCREQGYLPDAILNYLALLGWNPKDNQESFTHEQLIQKFSLDGIQKGGAVYNPLKLDSLNKEKLKQLPDEKLLSWGRHYFFNQNQERGKKFARVSDETLLKGLKTEIGRISSYYPLDQTLDWIRPDWTLPDKIQSDELIWKESNRPATITHLRNLSDFIAQYMKDFTEQEISKSILEWINDKHIGRGDILWPMRYALTGLPASPGPFAVAATIGKELTLTRLAKAIERLQ